MATETRGEFRTATTAILMAVVGGLACGWMYALTTKPEAAVRFCLTLSVLAGVVVVGSLVAFVVFAFAGYVND